MSRLHHLGGPAPASARANLVFIHGLGGHPFRSWGLEKDESWLTWLSADLPEVSFWTLEYDASPSKWFGSAMPLVDRAVNVLALLDGNGLDKAPLLLITHSMGGLLAKQLLRTGRTSTPEYNDLAGRISGIVFLATPHSGSSLATITDYLRFFTRRSVAVEELQAHAPGLRDLNLWFRNNFQALGIETLVFFETRPTHGVLIVDATSADPGIAGVTPIPVDADHVEISKPKERTNLAYLKSLKFMKRATSDGPFSDAGDEGADGQPELKALRTRLIEARSARDLRILAREAEAAAKEHPRQAEALTLKDDISLALTRQLRMQKSLEPPAQARFVRMIVLILGILTALFLFRVPVLDFLLALVEWAKD